MITKEQAINSQEFHYGECKRTVGPRGGVTIRVERYRRNGATQVWKTRPDEWRIPVKNGLRGYGQIRQYHSACWHAAEDCPLNKKEG